MDALFRLRSEPSKQIEFRRLEKTEAMLQIVRHTVAAKLFNRAMMKDHARFAKRLSTAVPIFEVSYPRNIEELPRLREAIARQINEVDQN